MDPLSITASAISVGLVVQKIYLIGNAAYKSEDEKKEFNSVMNDLSMRVKSLKVVASMADNAPGDHRFDGFRAVIQHSTQLDNGKNVKPDPNEKGPGVLQRLELSMGDMAAQLESRHGIKGSFRRLLWIHEKKKFEAFIAEIQQWTEVVSSVLQYDHFLVDIETNNYVRDTSSRVKNLEIEAAQAAEDRKLAAEDRKKAAMAEERKAAEKARKAKEQLRLDIVRWISQLRFRERQSALLNLPQTKLLEPELLCTEEFDLWTEGRPWILHCEGKPGAGKTLLCAFIGDHIKAKFENEGKDIPILYMFLNHKERDSQTLGNLWASLLKQLLQPEGASFRSIEAQRLYEGPESESRPHWEKFYQAFCAEVSCYERVVIIVDALDEASPIDVAPQLLDKLHKLPKDSTSVFLTSQRTEDGPPPTLQYQYDRCKKSRLKAFYRCHVCNDGRFYICEECVAKGILCEDYSHQLTQPREVIMSIEPSAAEIGRYVQAEFRAELELGFVDDEDYQPSTFGRTPLGTLLHEKPWLKEEISNLIIAKADGMFALAQLYLGSFRSLGLTEDEIEVMLDNPPEGYTGFYEQHMERISDGSLGKVASDLGMNALAWVVTARRPLRFVELQHALAVNLKAQGSVKPSTFRNKAAIVRATAGLITIDGDEHAAVRLNHSTAQRYFDSSRDRWFPNAQAHITQVSLYYLNLRQLSSPDQGEWEDKDFEMRELDFPFLTYAYQNWGDHADGASSDVDTQAAVLGFVTDKTKIAAAIQAMWFLKSEADVDWDVRKGANALHVCAWFGLTYAISSLLDQGMEVNSHDPKNALTALMYACRRGKTRVVTVLLARGARINAMSNRGSNALFEAVLTGHSEVVKILLATPNIDINAQHAKNSNQTALMIAAQQGKLEIVGALLAHDGLKVNQKDANDNTALSHAIHFRQTATAKYILDHSIEPLDLDSTNWKGSSALLLAASGGQDDIVEELLSKGADSSIKDRQGGGNALLRAIDGGHLETVQIMLKHESVNIYCLDDEERGLLHGAAVGGKFEISYLLLKQGLDVNAADKKDRTPLHDACRQGSFEIAKALLDAGADPTLKDKAGRDPWTVAWQNGQTTVMEVFESYDQGMFGEHPMAGKLPVWALAKLGHVDLLREAIATGNPELSTPDPDSNYTALHYAVLTDELEMVQMLLKAGMLTDAQDVSLRTPLHLAALSGSVSILTLLLVEAEDHDEAKAVNEPDIYGTSPLLLAYSNGHMECCLLLIEAGATIPPSKASLKQSLFFLAIEFGKVEVVQRLVQMGADTQMKNVLGLTGLQMAKESGKPEVETFLRKSRTSNSERLRTSMDEVVEERGSGENNQTVARELPSNASESFQQVEQVKEPVASLGMSLEQRFKALEVPANRVSSRRSLSGGGDDSQSTRRRARIPQLA